MSDAFKYTKCLQCQHSECCLQGVPLPFSTFHKQPSVTSTSKLCFGCPVLLQADRKLAGLRPFHRVAWKHFRDFGVFLPFGALDAHHNVPNKTLLDPRFGWMLGDCADPVDSWGVEVSAGHGRALTDCLCAWELLLQDLPT